MKAGDRDRHLRIDPCSNLSEAHKVFSEHHIERAVIFIFNQLDDILWGCNEYITLFIPFQLLLLFLANAYLITE